MFKTLGKEERQAAFSICVLNLSFESKAYVEVTDGRQQQWNASYLLAAAGEMRLDASDYRKILIPYSESYDSYVSNFKARHDRALRSRKVLRNANLDDLTFASCLLIDLINLKKFDGRGCVLLRNTVHCVGLSGEDYIWLVSQFGVLLQRQHEQVSHNHEKEVDSYRYAKIGAVAVGAGAVILLTAGLAAPAIAGALVLLGTSSAAAAGITGSVVILFGGTGAGLAGYKMSTRTTGLTDFQFSQYDTPGKMEVMIMVSGWMEEDDDDKRTFGVPPDSEHMPLRERLTRFYRLHDPARLGKVANEAECFAEDPDSLFDQMRGQYGADPLDPSSLVPPEPQPPSNPDGSNRYLEVLARCLERLAAAATDGVAATDVAPASACPQDVNPASSEQPAQLKPDHEDARDLEKSRDSDDFGLVVAAPVPGDLTVPEAVDVRPLDAAVDEQQKDLHMVDLFSHWHWRELSVSPLYELTLLHWEKELQRSLGSSILNLVKLLAGYAAETALRYTLLSALAAAVATPVLLIQLTSAIDNIWLVATERATAAGKEMAKALLERPHGSRPVTLVGYSMGCRVIFSCLKELARRLRELEMPASDSPPTGTGLQQDAGSIPAPAPAPTKPATGPAIPPPQGEEKSAATVSESSYFTFGGMFGSSASNNTTSTPGEKDPGASAQSTSVPASADAGPDKAAGGNGNAVRTVRELRALVKDVVLLGAPLNLQSKYWPEVRRVVAGRLVNGYSTEDMVLSVVYRFERYKISVSGVAPVPCEGVENVNLTHIVTQHTHYCTMMKEILEEINLAGTASLS